tara:strand:- start:917 stop:1909 length:993 start_codon:yes stop_codon:yes gene_type:complete
MEDKLMKKFRKDHLQGVIVSVPTFCDDNFNLLLDRQRTHLRWLIENGITNGLGVILIAGGSGEGYFLDDDEWFRLAEVLVEESQGKVPTMIGVFETSARRAAEKARHASDLGVDYIQMAPPHYMGPSEDEVFEHYRYVNDSSDVGILCYNIPWAMPAPAYEFQATIFDRLATLDNIVGIKWASDNLTHFLQMLRTYHDRFNFIDNMHFEGVFSHGARLGMKGSIDLDCNVAPRLSLKRMQLLRDNKFQDYDELELVSRFDPGLNFPSVQGPMMGEGTSGKMKLKALGLDAGPVFPTQSQPTESDIKAVRDVYQNSGFFEWVDWNQSIFDS